MFILASFTLKKAYIKIQIVDLYVTFHSFVCSVDKRVTDEPLLEQDLIQENSKSRSIGGMWI